MLKVPFLWEVSCGAPFSPFEQPGSGLTLPEILCPDLLHSEKNPAQEKDSD
jgi:hypothetical protein